MIEHPVLFALLAIAASLSLMRRPGTSGPV